MKIACIAHRTTANATPDDFQGFAISALLKIYISVKLLTLPSTLEAINGPNAERSLFLSFFYGFGIF
jgi:hypothetical protein